MTTQGPLFPAVGESVTSGDANEVTWATPANIGADDAAEAQVVAATFDSPDPTFYLVGRGFGFTIPAGSTIDGITVEVDRRSIIASSGIDQEVRLRDAAGVIIGDNKASGTVWPTTSTIQTYGGAADDWNTGLSASALLDMVNDADFGVFFQARANIANADVGVDFIRITINYTEPVFDVDAFTAAQHVPQGQTRWEVDKPPYDDTEEQTANMLTTSMDMSFLFTIETRDASDSLGITITDASQIEATNNVDVSDTLGVAVSDFSQVDIEGGVPDVQAILDLWVLDFEKHWPFEHWPWEHLQEIVITEIPTVDVNVSDTLDITVDDVVSSLDTGVIESVITASYSAFQGDVEYRSIETWDDYQSSSSIDIGWLFAGAPPIATVEELVSADPNYGQPQQIIEEFIYPTESPSIFDITAVFVPTPVNIGVSDTLSVSIDDASSLQRLEGIAGLVAAHYSIFQGAVEALQPVVLSIEDYSTFAAYDPSTLFATVQISVTDALDILLDDQQTVARLENIAGLVAAHYSAFQGSVEPLEPLETEVYFETVAVNSSIQTIYLPSVFGQKKYYRITVRSGVYQIVVPIHGIIVEETGVYQIVVPIHGVTVQDQYNAGSSPSDG